MNALSVKKQLMFAFAALVAAVVLVSVVALRNLAGADARFSGFVHGINERESMAVDVRIDANRRAIGQPRNALRLRRGHAPSPAARNPRARRAWFRSVAARLKS